MTDWQPIETAPRNGREVVCKNARGGEFYAHYNEDDGAWYDRTLAERDPVRWKPLPAPPAQEGEG